MARLYIAKLQKHPQLASLHVRDKGALLEVEVVFKAGPDAQAQKRILNQALHRPVDYHGRRLSVRWQRLQNSESVLKDDDPGV